MNAVPKDAVCAEIGVLHGWFSSYIWNLTRPQKLFLIDRWLSYPCYPVAQEKYDKWMRQVLRKFSFQIRERKVKVIRGCSHEVAGLFQDGMFDWIYVDADHSYEGVMKDLLSYEPKMKSNGLILGHDYWLNENSGVIEAVRDFCAQRSWRLRFTTGDYCPSFCLERA